MPHLVLATLLFVSSCLPVGGGGGSDFYRSDPRYTAGVPFTTVDPRTGAVAWSYGRGHPQFTNSSLECWMQLRSFWQVWFGGARNAWGTQRYETRGGPLISEPATYGVVAGFGTEATADF